MQQIFFGLWKLRKKTRIPKEMKYLLGAIMPYTEHTVFECVHWQSYRSVLTSIIITITAANIVGVIMASKKIWERILRLKKGKFGAAEQVGTPA